MNIEPLIFTTRNILDYVRKINNKSFDVNTVDSNKETVLSFLVTAIVRDGKYIVDPERTIDTLCAEGANVDFYGKDGYTPIQMAIINEAYALVARMIKYHKKGSADDYTILRMSAGVSNSVFFELMLETGYLDPSITSSAGNNIVRYLANENDTDKLDKLLKLFPELDINSVNRKGVSPMTDALNNNASGTAVLLKTKGGELKGKLTNVILAIDTEIVDEEYFIENPNDCVTALEMGKEYLLPKSIKDVFVF